MEPIDMAWDEEAWDAFCAAKTAAPALYAQLHAVLTRLANDPGAPDLRRRRLQDPGLFVITVTAGDDSWALLWRLADDGVPEVWYVGPSPF